MHQRKIKITHKIVYKIVSYVIFIFFFLYYFIIQHKQNRKISQVVFFKNLNSLYLLENYTDAVWLFKKNKRINDQQKDRKSSYSTVHSVKTKILQKIIGIMSCALVAIRIKENQSKRDIFFSYLIYLLLLTIVSKVN